MSQNFLTILLSRLAVNKAMGDYEKNQKENPGVLKPPIFILVVGIISMIFWATLMMIFLFSAQDRATVLMGAIVFGGLFVVGLFLVLYQINFKVIYSDGVILYRNIFRIMRKYDCQEIKHAYYKDRGGIRFIFKDGKKLTFDKEEYCFYIEIVEKEHIKCKFKDEENPVIKVYFHPFLMCPFWIICGGVIIGLFLTSGPLLFAVPFLLFCLGCQLSYTTYDKEHKILTRRKFGFPRRYNMNYCLAKPVYNNGLLMKIEILKYNKRVAKIPVSIEYKNRARLARELCKVSV